MDKRRYLNSAFFFKLLFSAVFCVFLSHSLHAQTADASIFVVDKSTNPATVLQAWQETPIRFTVEDVFFSKTLGRYLGQDAPESFVATASLLSEGSVIYTESAGLLTFNHGTFSFVLGSRNVLMPAILSSPNVVLRLDLPSQSATFSISSLPYAIHARVAEVGLSGLASTVSGNFVSTFSVSSGLVFGENSVVVRGARVGVGLFSPAYALDVAGVANFGGMYLNGQPLSETLSWRESSINTSNIYTAKKPVGIRTAFPNSLFALHVAATVNATSLSKNGNPITASNYWTQTVNPTYNLYIVDHAVAIGRSIPKESLDVNGAIRLDTTSSANTGAIRWAAVDDIKDFQGYYETLEDGVPTQAWRSLTGISGSGRADRVATWRGLVTRPNLDYVADLIHQDGVGFGIGVSPTARMHVAARSLSTNPVFLVTSFFNDPLIQIVPTGGVGIGTTAIGDNLEVAGTMNAQDLLIDGVPLRLTLSSGTYWLRNGDNDLYYLNGNVGIGRPDPSSLFEIAAPNHDPGEATQNPSVTFTAGYGTTGQQRYTLGINAQDDGVFRVEEGTSLGSASPLFVAFDDRFGIGLSEPKANLHVSGNTGLILTGLFEAINPGVSAITSTVSVTGAGTRMVYHPSKGIFRVGSLSGTSVYAGSQWDDESLGILTTAFGRDHLVSGNFSHAIGGSGHSVGGAYAMALGGLGNQAAGDFSVAMGRGAAANTHGSFVWADNAVGSFASVTENQFLIRSSGGVGVNTSQTGISIQFSTKNIALSVHPQPVGAVHFLGLLPDATDWGSAQSIVTELKTSGYLTSSGEMLSDFDSSAVLSFSPGFAYANLESEIRAVLALHSQRFVLDMKGKSSQSFVYTPLGGLGINTRTPSVNTLAIMDPVWVNATGNAYFLVQGTSLGEALFLTVGTENPATSPSFVVVASGNVGVGKFPDLLANGEVVSASEISGYLDSAGAIVAESFSFPDGQTLSATASTIVWAFRATTPNIYFPSANMDASGRLEGSGYVGIGTTSPNSVLEISNRSSLQSLSGGTFSPVITFDLDATDIYTMGVPYPESDVFRIGSGGASSLGTGSPLAVLDNRIGIAITRPLTSALSVGGNTIFSKTTTIGTANLNTTTNLAVQSVNASKFLVNNVIIDWLEVNKSGTTTDIFYDTVFDANAIPPIESFVGIGLTEPQYALDVAGTLNIVATSGLPSILMTNFIIDGDYYAYQLNFRDDVNSVEAALLVVADDLVLNPGTGASNINISKVFTRGEGSGGYIGMWSTDDDVPSFSVLARSNVYWTSAADAEAGVMLVTANTLVGKFHEYSDSFSVSNNVSLGSLELPVMVTAKSVISHNGDFAYSRSHDATKIDFLIEQWPEEGVDYSVPLPVHPIPLTGMFIRMENLPYNNADTRFSAKAKAIGLNVDVSAVSLQEFTDEGYRFPAVFMGASNIVGIGGTPNATLDVYGTLRAETFNIADGLSISTINVVNAIYIDAPGLVGFGTTLPTRALDIVGSIESIGMIAPVSVKNLSAGGSFTVGTTGYVGMGVTSPVAQWELEKQFNSLPSDDFTFQVVDVTVTDNLVDQPLVGTEIVFSTVSGNNYANKLGDLFNVTKVVGTGYKLDLSGLNVPTGGVVVGVSSLVSSNRDADRKAAIFLGGNVGVGTTTPEYPLEVVGTIFATNAPAANFLTEQEVASFSMLNLADSMVVGETGSFLDLMVATLNQNTLTLLGTLSIPEQSLVVNTDVLVQGAVSINQSVTTSRLVVSGLASPQTVSTNYLSVGGALDTTNALRVYGAFRPSSWTLTGGTLTSALLTVNNPALVVTGVGRVGIGTSVPAASQMHVKTDPYTVGSSAAVMDPTDYRTWNPIILQAAVSSGNAVGLAFLPDFADSGDLGSGVLAIKTSDTTTSSALAFVTDPQGEDAYPQERFRITDAGNVGVGTTAAEALLHVNGSFSATGMSFPTASLSVASMRGSIVTFSITTNVTAFAEMDRLRLPSLDFVPTSSPVATSANGQLFVDSATDQLFYVVEKEGDSIVGNLTVTASVSQDVFPYFDTTRSMAGLGMLKWATENSIGVLRISSTNEMTYAEGSRVLVRGDVSQSRTLDAALQKIQLGFKDRSTPGTARFLGMDVILDMGVVGEGPFYFHKDDRFFGLRVAVSENLRTQTTLPNGTVVSGSAVAAAFLVGSEASGNVSIASGAELESDLIPSAAMHVLSKKSNHFPLWIQTTVNATLVDSLFVSPNTDVGIGTTLTTARLSVLPQSDAAASLSLFGSSGSTALVATDTGVGIGVSQPSVALSVAGDVSASQTVLGGVLSDALSINSTNEGFFVSDQGEVMIGTSVPLGQFTMARQFTEANAIPDNFLMQDISQTLDDVVSQNITGVLVSLDSGSSAVFTGANGTKVATGMDLNLTALQASTGNPVVGVYTDMGLSGTAGAGRYAAVFLGGNVGFGVTEPTVALDISGDLIARNLIASGNWTLASVTTNVLRGQDATVTTFDIQSPTAISLEVTNELWIGASATVNIEGGQTQDTNVFRTVALNATLGTANQVFVGYDTADLDVFDYVSAIAADFPSNPALGIDGAAAFDSLTSPTLNIGSSISGSTLSLNSSLGITANRVNQSGSFQMASLYMRPTANVSGVALFVQDTSDPADPLVFRPSANSSVTINISRVSQGSANNVAGYNSSGVISDAPFLRYRDTSSAGVTYSVLSVGTVNATITSDNAVVGLYSGYGTTTGLGTVTASRVSVGMGPRITASESLFTGVSVQMRGHTPGQDAAPEQDLASGETVGGLSVDMNDSLKAYTVLANPDTAPVVGTKIAAIFRAGSQTSGNVGIHTDENLSVSFLPSADLHIVAATPNPIQIQTATRTGLGSDGRGYMSVGHAVPSASLSVVGYSDTEAFSLMAGSSQVMVAGDTGIGVGQAPNLADWSVAGTASANQLTVNNLSSTVLQVTSNIIITSDGFMGIGTLTPDASLTMEKLFALPQNLLSNYVQRSVSMSIATQVGADMHRPITGYEISLDTDSSSQFGTDSSAVSAVGLSVDLTSLQATTNGLVTGIHTSVGGVTGTRYGAILMGGGVGIGTTAPNSDLQVAGTIMARNVVDVTRVSVDATSATVNRLALDTGAVFENMTVATAGVDVVVLDTLRFAQTSGVTLNFAESLSNNSVWTSDGVIANVATFNALFIPAAPSDWVTPPAFWVSSNALFRNDLKLSPLVAASLYLGSLTATADLVVPTIQLAAGVSMNVSGNLSVGSSAYLSSILSTAVSTGNVWGSSLAFHNLAGHDGAIPTYRYADRRIDLGNLFKKYSGTTTTRNMAMYGTDIMGGSTLGIITSNTTLSLRPNTTSGNHIAVVSSMNASSKVAVQVIASLNTTALTSDYSAKEVSMVFGDRSTAQSIKFIGKKITLLGGVDLQETAVGVSVNLTQLKSESSTNLPLNEDFAVDGFKSSAVFLADNNGDSDGTVGVFTFDHDNSTAYSMPNATLHVGNKATGNAGPFLVSTTATANTVIVTSRNAGIWVASSDIQLQTIAFLVHATTPNALSVQTAANSSVLSALQTGSVGIGTTQAVASLNVVHDATTGYAMWIDNPATSNPFVMTGAGRVGLGNTAPTAILDVAFNVMQNTFMVPVTWRRLPDPVDTGCDPGEDRFLLGGTYEIGGATYFYGERTTATCYDMGITPVGAVFNIAATSEDQSTFPVTYEGGAAPLRVQSQYGVAMAMGQTGKLGIWRAAPTENYMAMAVSGSVMAGVDTDWSGPAWLDTPSLPVTYPVLHGYTVRQSVDFAFLGKYRESSAVSSNSVLMWGKDDGDVLVFQDLNQTELLRFCENPHGGCDIRIRRRHCLLLLIEPTPFRVGSLRPHHVTVTI